MARRNRHDNQREDRTSSYDPEYDIDGQEEDDDEDIFAEGSFGYGSSSGRSSVSRSSAERSPKRNSRRRKNKPGSDRGTPASYGAETYGDMDPGYDDLDEMIREDEAYDAPIRYEEPEEEYAPEPEISDFPDVDEEDVNPFAPRRAEADPSENRREKKQRKPLFGRRKKAAEQEQEEDEERYEERYERRDNIIRVGGDAELREENLARAKKRASTKGRIFVLVIILLIVAGAAWFVYNNIREYKGYKVLASTDTVYEANAEYTEFGGNLLKITSEGVSYIDPNGNVVWTAGADLKIPIAATRGNWAVVADKGGNGVHVFNTEGAVSNLTMPYKVLDCDVATQGAFVVILESDTTNYVNMYDKNGTQIYEMQTSIDKSGYPLDISISDDGQKLFTSYFFVEGIETKNNLTAYNFGSVGQNANADRIVGGFSLQGELVTRVQFLSNNLVAAFADTEVILYDMKETPSERCRIKYQQPKIQSIFFSESYLGTIERTSDAEDNTGYVMRVYGHDGDEMFHYAFNMAYDNIHAGKDEIILTGGNQCLIVTKKGRVKFRYAFDTTIRNMIPTSSSNEYIVTFEGKTEKIGLRMEDK